MISCLHGRVIKGSGEEVVVMTAGGVGYRLLATPAARELCVPEQEVTLETYLVVREDALDLFGFANRVERELFLKLLSVGGVGPKTALHIFALGSAEDITMAIGRGDVAYLTAVSGIGKKTAERVVVELKEKVAKAIESAGGIITNDAVRDVLDALITLGYSVLDARKAVEMVQGTGKGSEGMLREALRLLSKSS